MEEERARKNKRASILLAPLLAILAVILTIIALGPETRVPETSPERTPTPTPTPSATPSPGATSTSGSTQGGSGGGQSGSGGSGVVQCTVGGGNVACPKSFTIAGNAGGLYPGGTVQLPLTLSNPNSEDIRVTSITVSVAATSAPSCAAANLQPADYAGPGFVVPGNGSGTISLPLTLSHAAPDACQNVTFTLSYGGKAEPA